MTNDENVKKLAELIRGIQIAMMTTVETDGTLRSRPMATQKTPFDGELWFFTSVSSPKINELKRDEHVNLSYSSPEDNRYVSVSGSGSVVRDIEKARQLWSPIMKTWFPKGLEDPDLALMKVTVEQAEFWETKSSTMVQLFGFIKAMTTGKRPENLGDHEKINLVS